MIEQNVQVVRCQEKRVWVRLGSQTGCTACDNGNGCGAGIFAKLLQRKPVILELAQNDMSVEPGQMVTLAFSEQVYLKLVFASYGWPLLAALAGAFGSPVWWFISRRICYAFNKKSKKYGECSQFFAGDGLLSFGHTQYV